MVESELRKIFRRAKERARLERHRQSIGEKPWHTYGSGILSYQTDFDGLPGSDFQVLVDDIVGSGRQCFVMDAFSDGHAIRGLRGVSGGLAITLADLRTQSQQNHDDARNIRVIEGNFAGCRTVTET